MKQAGLDLPLAGTVADVRDRLKAADPAWSSRKTLTCFCCGEKYLQGQWKCCAPRGGQTSANWMQEWHENCPTGEGPQTPANRRCPRHCRCERVTKGGNLPLPRAPMTPAAAKQFAIRLRDAADTGARRSSLPAEEDDGPRPSDESEADHVDPELGF